LTTDNGAAILHRGDRLQRRRSGRPPSQQHEVARPVDQVLGHAQPDARQPAGDQICAVFAADRDASAEAAGAASPYGASNERSA
jgi:hypothetical protein